MLFNYGRPHPAPGAAAPAAPCVWLRSPLLSFPAPRPAARGSACWRRRLPAALPPRVLERGRPRLAPGVGGAGCAPGGGGPPCRREAHDRNAPLFSLKAAFLSRAFLGATACLGCRWPASAPPPPHPPCVWRAPGIPGAAVRTGRPPRNWAPTRPVFSVWDLSRKDLRLPRSHLLYQ